MNHFTKFNPQNFFSGPKSDEMAVGPKYVWNKKSQLQQTPIFQSLKNRFILKDKENDKSIDWLHWFKMKLRGENKTL